MAFSLKYNVLSSKPQKNQNKWINKIKMLSKFLDVNESDNLRMSYLINLCGTIYLILIKPGLNIEISEILTAEKVFN